MQASAEQIERLSPTKRALLDRWRQAAGGPSTATSIPRRDQNHPAPLSFAQQRLWVFDQLEPGNPAYNVATAVRLVGPLVPELLEAALRSVIARHEILRTTFRSVDGQPVQVVAPQLDWQLQRCEFRADQPLDREAWWQQLAQAESLLPFDLERGSLLRGTLLRLNAHEHVLLLTLHHIICDGWSMAVLRSEVARAYAALRQGHAPALEELSIQYADYAAWQREQLDTARLDRLLPYWSRQFAAPPPALELPLDYPRPTAQTFRGAVCRLSVDSLLLERLRGLAAAEGTTLFVLLETTLHILLARFSGQRDICVGTPIANRNQIQLESLIGFFTNTLALRADLSANPTLREFLSQVRHTTLDALAHQDLPFDVLVDHLNLPRDLSRTPLFQVLFVLQNIPLQRQEIAGLTAAQVSFDHAPVSTFDLTLNADELADRLDLSLIYNPDLFAGATARQLLAAYRGLLAALVEQLDCPVLELPLASTEPAESLGDKTPLDSLPSTPVRCVHELIVDQARRTPAAAAVVFGEQILTYSQLDERSNRLAHYLIHRGVGLDDAVGVCLERSIDQVVAVLAILKAGGAYLPLDPGYPRARLDFMVRDAGLSCLVTTHELSGRAPCPEIDTILLDHHAVEIASCDARPVECRATPDQLAYIIYTSGSTGEPKGVEVEHRGLANHAQQFAHRLQLGPQDRLLQFLSLSFDAAGEEIFPTLISGATLCLHPTPAELSGGALLDWSRNCKVNVLHLTPAVWLSLLDELSIQSPAAGRHLKAVVAGGDSVSREDARRWVEVTGGQIPFLLAYGVTEATITTTLCEAGAEFAPSASGRLPIGRPLAQTRVYVLDEFQQPVPVGVRGELYLGGIGVARGYRNRSQLTCERFVADPFAADGSRMYRTGDSGRCLRDGNIEFLGRLDQQLKIRGYRVEPGEIETALCRHPAVTTAAVIAVADTHSHQRLIGYVAASASARPTEAELHRFLAECLPPHMIPAAIVVLDELPQLPNGKIDRRSLPAPDHRPTSDDRTPPRDEVERLLCTIWSNVLDVSPIGVHDNFFEIGGDSIRSIQVVARARDAGLRFTPKQLFEHQTIAELAPHALRGAVIQAEQGPVTGPVPLTPIQRQFFALQLADPHHFNQSVLLAVRPHLGPQPIEAALGQLVVHHDALRLRFTPGDNGDWLQTGLPIKARPATLQIIDLSSTAESAIAAEIELAAKAAQASLDLESGPLLRGVYFDLGPERAARLLIVVHHLAVDAVSWRILLEDLSGICRQLAEGEPVRMPPKTTSLADWSRRLTAYADSSQVRRSAANWLPEAAATRIPIELTASANLVAAESTIPASLSAGETAHWLRDSQAAYRTRPHELLIAALVETLCSYAGGDRICIDLEGHGREELFEDVDLSRTVGWFTSLYPRVLCRPPQQTPDKLIKSIKEQVRAVEQGGIDYGVLRWLTPDAELRQQLTAAGHGDVSFNYLGQFDNLLPGDGPFCLASEPKGLDRSPRGSRPHLWEIIAYVHDGRLHIDWHFARDMHRPETIVRLSGELLATLRRLIAHCLEPDAGGATPADFPLAAIDQEDLDRLAELLGDTQAAGGE